MKYIFALILAINLTGCMYQTVSNNDITSSILICGSVDNIYEISANFIGEESVRCTNRVSTMINSQSVANAHKN